MSNVKLTGTRLQTYGDANETYQLSLGNPDSNALFSTKYSSIVLANKYAVDSYGVELQNYVASWNQANINYLYTVGGGATNTKTLFQISSINTVNAKTNMYSDYANVTGFVSTGTLYVNNIVATNITASGYMNVGTMIAGSLETGDINSVPAPGLSQALPWKQDYKSSISYSLGDEVTHNNILYIANSNTPIDMVFPPNKILFQDTFALNGRTSGASLATTTAANVVGFSSNSSGEVTQGWVASSSGTPLTIVSGMVPGGFAQWGSIDYVNLNVDTVFELRISQGYANLHNWSLSFQTTTPNKAFSLAAGGYATVLPPYSASGPDGVLSAPTTYDNKHYNDDTIRIVRTTSSINVYIGRKSKYVLLFSYSGTYTFTNRMTISMVFQNSEVYLYYFREIAYPLFDTKVYGNSISPAIYTYWASPYISTGAGVSPSLSTIQYSLGALTQYKNSIYTYGYQLNGDINRDLNPLFSTNTGSLNVWNTANVNTIVDVFFYNSYNVTPVIRIYTDTVGSGFTIPFEFGQNITGNVNQVVAWVDDPLGNRMANFTNKIMGGHPQSIRILRTINSFTLYSLNVSPPLKIFYSGEVPYSFATNPTIAVGPRYQYVNVTGFSETKLPIWDRVIDAPLVVTNTSNASMTGGYLGIGTTSPSYPLDITGTAVNYSGTNYVFSTNTTFTSNTITPYLGRVNGGLLATYFGSVSDKRIKANISSMNIGYALSELRNITPVTYNYIDTMTRGSNAVMGFIAQQVAEEMPVAVTTTTSFIPNIYANINISSIQTVGNTSQLFISLSDPANAIVSSLSTNAIYSAYLSNNCNFIGSVSSVMNDTLVFTTPSILPNTWSTTAFMYGQEVSDFNTLNKDYLYTINFAATQDLDQIVQSQQSTITGLTSILQTVCTKLGM